VAIHLEHQAQPAEHQAATPEAIPVHNHLVPHMPLTIKVWMLIMTPLERLWQPIQVLPHWLKPWAHMV
jgi:hypothetical protein